MKTRKSYEMLKSIQNQLSWLSKDLEIEYGEMWKECQEEIRMEEKQNSVKQKNDMYWFYEKCSEDNELRIMWIKRKLPWYVRLFSKITSTDIILKDTSVYIGVNFGKSSKPNCYVEVTPYDIGWKQTRMS